MSCNFWQSGWASCWRVCYQQYNDIREKYSDLENDDNLVAFFKEVLDKRDKVREEEEKQEKEEKKRRMVMSDQDE